MSQLTALRAPRTSSRTGTATTSSRPRLRVVAPADTPATGGVGFAIGCMVLLVCGLVAVLLLNTVRAQQSFTLDTLQSRSTVLSDRQQSLGTDLQRASAPQQLALRAERMGLRPADKVRYVRASDGKVLGVAKAGAAGTPFTVGTLPTTPASRAAGVATAAATDGIVEVKPPSAKKKAKGSSSGTHDRAQKKSADQSKKSTTSSKESSEKAAGDPHQKSKKTSEKPDKTTKKSTR